MHMTKHPNGIYMGAEAKDWKLLDLNKHYNSAKVIYIGFMSIRLYIRIKLLEDNILRALAFN